MTIRRCVGPKGEPGFANEHDGVLGVCHTYDPNDPMSKIRMERELIDEARALEESRLTAGQPT